MTTSLVRSVEFSRARQALDAGAKGLGLRHDDHMPRPDWEDLGRLIADRGRTVLWQLGDWLLYGEFEYGETYADTALLTGYDEGTLRNLKSTAGRFDLSRRRDNLSLAHHTEVAALPRDEQDRWLDLAEQHGWGRNELRDRVKGRELDSGTGSTVTRIVYHLKPTAQDDELFARAAEKRGLGVGDWLLDVAREHALAELEAAA